MQNRFQVLSLDGGGLKGLFSIALLANWEKNQGTRVSDHFDLIVGTSTGGIIALALGLGFKAEEVRDLYVTQGEKIFPPSMMGDAKQWLDVKYSSEGLKVVLLGFLKNKRLGDSRKRLLIPAFDPKFEGIHIFKTPHHRRLKTDYRESAVHVAMATSAAPTYFQSHVRDSGLELVDGGVWANNPVMLGVTEAMGYLQRQQDEIAVLRIGTTDEVKSVGDIKTSGGKLAMAAPLIEFMMKGQSQSASGMALQLLGKERYHAINPKVASGDFKLDKVSEELIAMADAQWRHESSELLDKGFLDHEAGPYVPEYQP
ncbi:MAG: CBASS cGAMP-activated phospholipase [Cyanobacteria bacterium J06656_5]